MVENAEPGTRGTVAKLITRYLFAKGVEGVILWGHSPNGQIAIYFHPSHFTGKLQTEVAPHLHHYVENSLTIGDSIFDAHLAWLNAETAAGRTPDFRAEVTEMINWIPFFGISYGLAKKFQALR